MTSRNHTQPSRRRGATAAMVLLTIPVLVGVAALTIDTGLLYNTRDELQQSSDAAALAGTLVLLDQGRLKGGAELAEVIDDAREQTGIFAGLNHVYNASPTVVPGDVTVGYLRNPFDPTESLAVGNPSRFNAVRVRVRRDATSNGPIQLLFARIFGRQTTEVRAEATAACMDGIVGYHPTPETGNAELLPLALKVTSWNNLLNGTVTTGDKYAYDSATGQVTAGSDGIRELNLYPGGGVGQLPPGNFGTVDIGSPNNSTADLSRQIRYGVSPEDLAYFGGELRFGADGTLLLNGDTGLSAGIKDDLTSIIGKPRAIPLFSKVTGPGNNAMYTIVGFAGIRIMYVKLTGSMSSKKVIIQPAVLVDDSVIAGPATGSSYFVYQPVQIVR